MSYEDQLIREMTAGEDRWCSQCEHTAEDCVCEELSDHFREVCSCDSGEDVRVFPASPETHTPQEPTSFSEWLEQHEDSI